MASHTVIRAGLRGLRADFNNGEQLYAMAGQVIELPARRADRPSREFLQWHLDELFQT